MRPLSVPIGLGLVRLIVLSSQAAQVSRHPWDYMDHQQPSLVGRRPSLLVGAMESVSRYVAWKCA